MKLELTKIFNNSDFIFDSVRECFRPNKIRAHIDFKYNLVTQQEKIQFMISFKYNSMSRPFLNLKINGQIINSSFLTSYTSSYDSMMSIRVEEGPFYLKPGINEFQISSPRIFPDTYEIEIYPYTENINTQINPYSYKMSDFVVLECYNLYGGFYWHINNFIMCCYFCEKFKKIPIVNFSNGLFSNNTSVEHHLIKLNPNWFYNYFQNYVDLPPSIYQTVLDHGKKVRIDNKAFLNFKKYKNFCNENQCLEFKREAFNFVKEKCYVDKAHKPLIQKYLKPLPHIQNIVSEIKKQIFPERNENIKMIGIHYRGTDKIEEKINKEQYPKKYSYLQIYEMIVDRAKELMLENQNYDIYIIACSDEQEFINFFKRRLGKKLIYYDGALRSAISTSDLKEDFTKIPNRGKDIKKIILSEEQKKIYDKRQELLDNSIHMGNKNISNNKKGLDCLIDVLLMDEVDILFQSKGNFSLYCGYFNPKKNLEIIDIQDKLG